MTDSSQNPKSRWNDEADTIRRFSPGDRMTSRHGGSNAKASIDGSFWIALAALLGVIAVGIVAGYVLGTAEARDEYIDARLGVLGSRISVLEYDAARICAQLLEADLVEACH